MQYERGFPGDSVGKESACNAGDTFWSLGHQDLLKEGMATHFNILAWSILRTEEPGGLQPMGSQKVRHDWSNWTHIHTNMQYGR